MTEHYMMAQKGELMSALQASGPVSAITTCQTRAPAIAREQSKDGWVVGRTSSRVRNPANTPDAWESAILRAFAERQKQGESLATMEASIIETVQGRRQFRYMKAIGVAEPCTVCHGTQLAPAVREALSTRYPADQATGYSTGELRGAFTLRKPLD